MDSEDLSPPLLLAASCCGGHVIRSLLSCAQQPVGHQSLPGATEVWSLGVRGGSTVAPPDGVAGGKDSDSVIPERKNHKWNRLKSCEIFTGSSVL